ncbi:MAG TPA: hypothetical protein VH044_13245 [Polyangiaceae bacterium]|nr:hypothetical protein [Polyangiaceae bacterium]
MPKPPASKESPLVLAAAALDEELRHYDALADEAKRARIDSAKTLERAVRIIQESTGRNETVQDKLRGLVAEIEAARLRQVESLNTLLEAAQRTQARSEQYDALLKRFAALGDSARHVNALAVETDAKRRADAGEADLVERLGTMETRMAGVVAEAEALAALASEQDWSDLAKQADAVRQQILAAKNKISTARRAAVARAPS